jgi:hypothetical protein
LAILLVLLQEVYAALEKTEPDVASLTTMGEKLSHKSKGPALATIHSNISNLHERWDHVRNRANDRKVSGVIASQIHLRLTVKPAFKVHLSDATRLYMTPLKLISY